MSKKHHKHHDHHTTQAESTHFQPSLGASLLGLLVLAAAGWVLRKQVVSLSAPLLHRVSEEVSETSQKPWVKSMVSWLQSCPYTVSINRRIAAGAHQ